MPITYIHIIILTLIMIIFGFFGGYLNYLHNFDTNEINESAKNKKKYILLGMGAAFIVPLMLNTIKSNLIDLGEKQQLDFGSYLIFAGFCLIAAIFSKRFITTIGEKILETAKKAEKTAKENSEKIATTQKELISTNVKIEDVKSTVDLQTTGNHTPSQDENPLNLLLETANSYVERTNISGYSERVALKGEIGRKMGELIVRNNFPKEKLLTDHPSEGMFVAIAYSIQFKPDNAGLDILNKLSNVVTSLFGKAKILGAYRTLAQNSFINKSQVKMIYDLIVKFRDNADTALIKNIENTINILKIIDPTIG